MTTILNIHEKTNRQADARDKKIKKRINGGIKISRINTKQKTD